MNHAADYRPVLQCQLQRLETENPQLSPITLDGTLSPVQNIVEYMKQAQVWKGFHSKPALVFYVLRYYVASGLL